MKIKEPTQEQCSSHEKMFEDENNIGYAIWYPQMGGYCGKAIAVFGKDAPNICFDVHIWHDGNFPFSGEGVYGIQPIIMHHCEAKQFVTFGETMMKLMCEDENLLFHMEQ